MNYRRGNDQYRPLDWRKGAASDGAYTYFSAKILNVDLAGANLERLLSDSVKIFFLANVGRKGDDLVSFFLESVSARRTKHENESRGQ